jgi:hypothetical protein
MKPRSIVLIAVVAMLASCAGGVTTESVDNTTTLTTGTTAQPSTTSSTPPTSNPSDEPPEAQTGSTVADEEADGESADESSRRVTPTTAASEQPAAVLMTVPGLADLVALVAEQESIAAADVEVIRAQRVVWSDASLGCPSGGMMYAQVLTDGYWVVLRAGGVDHDFRAALDGEFSLCTNGIPPADILVDR